MEQVLDVYQEPPDDDVPLICMDEASKELHADVAGPLPVAPGRPARQDDKYERNGTRALFMFFAPHLGWRRVTSRERRTRIDWAHEVRRLIDEDFPTARKVRMVCDNLNTHNIASLYEAFGAVEAHRLARKLELVHTPRNGSWLNVAEIELSFLSRQCTNRRLADGEALERELDAWTNARNAEGGAVTWQFTTAHARTKLRHLYPLV